MLEKHKEELPKDNIFMYCEKINVKALRQMPEGYYIRNLLKEELEIWKSLPFDNNYKETYKEIMDNYYDNIYRLKENIFYNNCKVVCNDKNEIIGSCFLWKFYDIINTLHWLKIKNEYENLGIGKGLISKLVENLNNDDFPIFLHTQPESFRAIKLYSDFGFKIAKNNKIGKRLTNINECLPKLKENIPEEYFKNIEYGYIPNKYLKIIEENNINDF